MVSLGSAIGLVVIVCVHTAVAAVGTRFFRERLETAWGAALYAVFLIPVVLTISTLVLSGPLGLGGDLGSRGLVVTLVIGVPFALGYTIDVFWMPPPEEVDVPDTTD